MLERLNNSHVCFCCSRRSDALAVGKPSKLAWYCQECGPDLAKKALSMQEKDLDTLEKFCVVKVAEEAGEGDVTITAAELPSFISWAVKSFAETMRKHLDEGGAPF
jgi:ribosomal protein L37AE/L43A